MSGLGAESLTDLRVGLEAAIREFCADGPAASRASEAATMAAAELGELELDGVRAAAVGRAVGEVFHILWLEGSLGAEAAKGLVERLGQETGVRPKALALEVLTHHGQLLLAPGLALQTHLDVLAALTGVRHASLWLADSRGRITCRHRAATERTPGGARRLVQSVVDGHERRVRVEGPLLAAPVVRWQQPFAVILVQDPAGGAAMLRVFLERSAEMVALMLERQAVLTSGARAEQTIAGATERRLARLGLDLHDGPLQTVIAAAQELERCRAGLSGALAAEHERARVGGWLEDLEERLSEVEAELRGYSSSLGTPGVLRRPLADAITQAVEDFRHRSAIEIHLEISGELHLLTQSQQIALARIVQEALNNVRTHSRATEVRVAVSATRDHMRAVVRDNGIGFDMERTLVRAAASGRLGLLGMDERVRLLGGMFQIRSRDGGPTELTVVLPRWEPASAPSEDWNSQ